MMQLTISPECRARFKTALRRAGRREIGGVLMGEQLAPGQFQIIDFSVDDKTGTNAHFVRSPDMHQKALEDFFARTGNDFRRFNYLGEWHSHPSFPAIPSSTDIQAMENLINGERNIAFSVLLILRLRMWLKLDMSATLFTRKEGGGQQLGIEA